MPFVIKAKLPTTALRYYKNTQDDGDSELKAVNIRLCNLTAAPVSASLSFYCADEGQVFGDGAVLFEQDIPANDAVEISDRYIYIDDIIEAYAGAADSISLSIDIEGDNGRYLPPAP